MPRNFKATSRFTSPDSRYGSILATKFINKIMLQGKKTLATRIFYEALEMAAKRVDLPPEEVFVKALENVKPHVEVRSRRVGGSTYQVPREVDRKRAQSLGIRVIVNNARKRKGMPMVRRLAAEFTDACNHAGASVTWKENLHKMADANRAYSHLAY